MVTRIKVYKTTTTNNVITKSDQVADFIADNPSPSGYALSQIEGLTPVDANLVLDGYADRDGSAFNMSALTNREIGITFKILTGYVNGKSMVKRRNEFFKTIFPPTETRYIELYSDLETDVYEIMGYVTEVQTDYFGETEGAKATLTCPDPYFRCVDKSKLGF